MLVVYFLMVMIRRHHPTPQHLKWSTVPFCSITGNVDVIQTWPQNCLPILVQSTFIHLKHQLLLEAAQLVKLVNILECIGSHLYFAPKKSNILGKHELITTI
ncbi:hypothetical protein BLOT_007235 [Blomia tropicalis]|nr:hypothetical protein BLOT_007235 [Blomia tropicalis]